MTFHLGELTASVKTTAASVRSWYLKEGSMLRKILETNGRVESSQRDKKNSESGQQTFTEHFLCAEEHMLKVMRTWSSKIRLKIPMAVATETSSCCNALSRPCSPLQLKKNSSLLQIKVLFLVKMSPQTSKMYIGSRIAMWRGKAKLCNNNFSLKIHHLLVQPH